MISNDFDMLLHFYICTFSKSVFRGLLEVGVICTVITEVQDAQTEKRDMKTVPGREERMKFAKQFLFRERALLGH